MRKNRKFVVSFIVSVLCVVGMTFGLVGCGKSGTSSVAVQNDSAMSTDATPVPVVVPPMVEEMAPVVAPQAPETEMSLDATPVVAPVVPAPAAPVPASK